MSLKTVAHFSPGRLIFFSIFLTIIVGTAALALPGAHTNPLSLFDLLFTATSATCVTGIFTIPLDNFTSFGHTIILILTQIGGLGLITLTIFIMSLFVNLGLATQIIAFKLLDLNSWKNLKNILVFIIITTFAVELLGALLILPILYQNHSFKHACFLSIFHAITSFCNAGISIFEHYNLQNYAHHYGLLLITIGLMFIGSFGFLTWHEIVQYGKARMAKRRHPLSLNTKIIIYSTAALILLITCILFALEHNHAFAGMSTPLAFINSLFHAVSSRNSGFLTVNIHTLQLTSILCMLAAACIGSAPASTGSGVKITTFSLFLATIKAAITGRTSVEIRGRTIGIDQVYKAIAIISLSVFWMIMSIFFLTLTNCQFSFFDLVTEAVSSFTNLGISSGITRSLSAGGQVCILINMIIGRIGSLTLLLALKELRHARIEKAEFSYPEERVILS